MRPGLVRSKDLVARQIIRNHLCDLLDGKFALVAAAPVQAQRGGRRDFLNRQFDTEAELVCRDLTHARVLHAFS